MICFPAIDYQGLLVKNFKNAGPVFLDKIMEFLVMTLVVFVIVEAIKPGATDQIIQQMREYTPISPAIQWRMPRLGQNLLLRIRGRKTGVIEFHRW